MIAGGALSSCQPVPSSDLVAKVNGVTLTAETVDGWMRSELIAQVSPADRPGTALGGLEREVVTYWVRNEVTKGLANDTAAVAEQEKTFASRYGTAWTAAPAGFRATLVDYAVLRKMQEDGTLDTTKLKAAIEAAHVSVDPRLGVWDVSTLALVGHSGA